ncbi:MAG TPA: helix-hairpin-helix domain-containing protein [Bdellovibrionota bacterium]|nr:helix-hairpin-helix domain-containing protein [Bdellovibrionota bacterium]
MTSRRSQLFLIIAFAGLAVLSWPRKTETLKPSPAVGTAQGVPLSAPSLSPERRLLSGDRIDVNSASYRELIALPGVGPKLATEILAYRRLHGPFRTVRQLDHVPGIGPKKLADLEPLVVVATSEHR